MQQLIAIAGKRGRQHAQPRSQGRLVITRTGLMARHRAVEAYELTGPPLAHQPTLDQMGHRLATRSGPYQFFDRSSFRAA